LNKLSYIHHKVFYNCAKYPVKSMVSQQAKKEELVKTLEDWLPVWVTLHSRKFNAILQGPEATFKSTKYKFLEQLSAHIKKSLVRMYIPAEIAKQTKEVKAQIAQNQADPTSQNKFEGFLQFFTSAMGNPSP
jgi:hypothetical protein